MQPASDWHARVGHDLSQGRGRAAREVAGPAEGGHDVMRPGSARGGLAGGLAGAGVHRLGAAPGDGRAVIGERYACPRRAPG